MARAIPDWLSEITNSVAGPTSSTSTPTQGRSERTSGAPRVLGIDVHEHDAGDVVVARALEEGVDRRSRCRALAGEEQQVVAAGADGVLEPDQHLVEERVAEGIGVALAGLEEDADQMRALRDEAARRRRRGVVELLRQPDDPLARLGVDVRVAVQRPGDRADRHAAQACQLSDCHSLIGHRKRFLELRRAV
jgi:hypothetical protein